MTPELIEHDIAVIEPVLEPVLEPALEPITEDNEPLVDGFTQNQMEEPILTRLYAGELSPATIETLVGPGDDLSDLP